jgi:hypothetical protein
MNDLSLKETRNLICNLITNQSKETKCNVINSLSCSYAVDSVLTQVQPYFIKNCKVDRRSYKFGDCHRISSCKTYDGFLYVEGVAKSLASKHEIYHSWNYNNKHGYIDFTFAEITKDFSYQGICIPTNILMKIAIEKKYRWGPIIPFLNSFQLNEVINFNKHLISKNRKL